MSQGSIDAGSDGSGDMGAGLGTSSNHSRFKSLRPSSKISMSSVGLSAKQQSSNYNARRTESPERVARKQYNQAKEYEKKMMSRVNYLAKEGDKFMKKIEKTRDDAIRLQ